MREKFKRVEVWLKLILFGLFISFYMMATSFPEKSKQFPQLIALFSLIFIAFSLIIDFTKKEVVAKKISSADDAELTAVDEAARNVVRKRLYRAWGIILVSTTVGLLGGFLLSSFFFFIGFAFIFGKKKNVMKKIAAAVAGSLLIYVIFQRVMGVPLLQGMFW